MNKKVSCHVITFNQKDYISQCIDGILMQKTNFDFEIVIGDDNSTDGTRKILLDYVAKYPEKIKLNLREVRGKGIPGKENFITTLAMCDAEYITLCDGDDYWIDPFKLQKQVDFLEANTEYLIHSGNANIHLDDFLTSKTLIGESQIKIFNLKDFYFSNHLVTCTVMFRNINIQFPKQFYKILFGDWFLYTILLNTQKDAKAYQSLESFSAYRQHTTSIMGSLSKIESLKNHIKQYILIYGNLKYSKDKFDFKNKINTSCIACFRLQIDEKKNIDALKLFILNFKYCGFKIFWRKYISKVKNDFKV